MFCLATRLFLNGRSVPRSELGPLTKDGRFQLKEGFDPTAHRTVRVARLRPMSGAGEDLLPPLWDAVVMHASGSFWTLTGIERVKIDAVEVSFRQTWALRELPAAVCEEIESAIASGLPAKAPLTMMGMTAMPPEPPETVDPRKSHKPTTNTLLDGAHRRPKSER